MSYNNNGFNPNDRNCWYFGPRSRQEANEILMSENDDGVFIIRESTTQQGAYVLCVREGQRVNHYIINHIVEGNRDVYTIGDNSFESIEKMLVHYSNNVLDSTLLIRPAHREKFYANLGYASQSSADLSFSAGDVLTLISKASDDWWECAVPDEPGANPLAPLPPRVRKGRVPRSHIEPYDPEKHRKQESASSISPKSAALIPMRKLPAEAVVVRPRIPSVYDSSALRLSVGERLSVTEISSTGLMKGAKLDGNCNVGLFPVTCIRFEDVQE